MSDTVQKVFVLTVTEHGPDGDYRLIHLAYSTRDKAVAALAEWCRSQWEEQDKGGGKDLPAADQGAIAAYFDFWRPESEYEIEVLALDVE